MSIVYNDTKKDLPCGQLEELFISAGWSDGSGSSKSQIFNAPFINSTLVISAWEDERLVGTVRVLSDKIIRSVLYDLVVLPGYHGRGIGRELISRCIAHYPKSEWLVGTEHEISGYYEKLGFKVNGGVFLSIPSVYQRIG